MASLSAEEQEELAYEDNTPTPAGWRRKLIPHIGKGLIPARIDVVFVAPNGEEFKSKAKLQQYLKVNKGSPSISEFIWNTDETLRRSSRSASKQSSSPPKTTSKKKPAREVPREEAKATKRSHPDHEKALSEDKKQNNKKAKKVTLTESQENANGKVSPGKGNKDINNGLTNGASLRKAKEGEEKPTRGTKKKKGVKAESKSDKASENAAEIVSDVQNGKQQHKNGKEREVEVNGKEDSSMEDNGKEDSLEQLISPDEDKDVNTLNMQTEVQDNTKAKDSHHDVENEGPKDVDNDDVTTTSLLGSDLSAEGMEADSDIFESKEKRALQEEEGDTAQQGEQANASADS